MSAAAEADAALPGDREAGGQACAVGDEPAARRSLAHRLRGRRARQFRRGRALRPVGVADRALFFRPAARRGPRILFGSLRRAEAPRFYQRRNRAPGIPDGGQRVPPGARVLDVGCGLGGFRACVPEADYTGLDPHMAAARLDRGRSQRDARPASRRPCRRYDAVCCFEVVEHVRDPKALFAELVQAAKPGGLVCVSVPRVPSPMTRIPNFLINAPPHHLTWWSEAALRALAEERRGRSRERRKRSLGNNSGIYWIERFSPIKCRDVHFRGAPSWHAASADRVPARHRGVEAVQRAENDTPTTGSDC